MKKSSKKISKISSTFEVFKVILKSRGVESKIYINYTLKILVYYSFFDDLIFNNNIDKILSFLSNEF